jgi:hypothetical protein
MNRVLTFLLLGVFSAPLVGQSADTSVHRLVNRLLFRELRGGGWRDSLTWQPQDSSSARLLKTFRFRWTDNVLPPGDHLLECPASTDSSKGQLPQPVGYTVLVRVDPAGHDSATVHLALSCRFSYHGKRSLSIETGTWLVARSSSGWRVLHVLNRSIT